MVQPLRDRRFEVGRLRRADNMRCDDQRDAKQRENRRAAEGDHRQPRGSGKHCAPPPDLPAQEIHDWRRWADLWWQARSYVATNPDAQKPRRWTGNEAASVCGRSTTERYSSPGTNI